MPHFQLPRGTQQAIKGARNIDELTERQGTRCTDRFGNSVILCFCAEVRDIVVRVLGPERIGLGTAVSNSPIAR